jgi:hypothetical protein
MTVNRIPMPKNREPSPTSVGSRITGSKSAVQAICAIDAEESSQRNTNDVRQPNPPVSIPRNEDIDVSDCVKKDELVDEDMFEEFYRPLNEVERSETKEIKRAENPNVPFNRELEGVMVAAKPEAAVVLDRAGSVCASLCPAPSANEGSSMSNIVNNLKSDLHAAAPPAQDGISGVISSCNEMINSGTNFVKKNHLFCPLRTVSTWFDLELSSDGCMNVLLIQTC